MKKTNTRLMHSFGRRAQGGKISKFVKNKHKSSSIAYNIICKKQREKKRVLSSYTAISIFRNLHVNNILYEITTVSITGTPRGQRAVGKMLFCVSLTF